MHLDNHTCGLCMHLLGLLLYLEILLRGNTRGEFPFLISRGFILEECILASLEGTLWRRILYYLVESFMLEVVTTSLLYHLLNLSHGSGYLRRIILLFSPSCILEGALSELF